MKVCVAAAQYPIDPVASWAAYEVKLGQWVAEAAGEGAQLLLFPEYGAMELARIAVQEVWSNLQHSIDFVGDLRAKVDALHVALAKRYDVHIVASSLPQRDPKGAAYNVARVVSPKGRIGEQRKLMMTRFEREKWHISGGREINVNSSHHQAIKNAVRVVSNQHQRAICGNIGKRATHHIKAKAVAIYDHVPKVFAPRHVIFIACRAADQRQTPSDIF